MLTPRFFTTSFLVFLFFGTVSCAPDKKDRHIQDSWNIPDPVLNSSGPQKSEKPILYNAFKISPNLMSQDVLAFPSLKTHDFANSPVTTTVNSICQDGETQVAAQSTFANTADFKIRDLVPQELLLRPQAPKTPLHCSIELIMKNSHNSIHRFRLNNASIHGIDADSDLSLLKPSLTVTAGNEPLFQSPEFPQIGLQTLPRSPGKLILGCEKFQTQVTETDLSQANLIELIRGPATARDGLTDPRGQFPQQRCRILAQTNDNPSRPLLSPYFNLRFELPKLQIQSSTLTLGEYPVRGALEFQGFPFFRTVVHNPYAFDVVAAVNKDPGKSLQLQSTFTHAGPTSSDRGTQFTLGLNVVVTAGTNMVETPAKLVFTVPAGKSVVIEGQVSEKFLCYPRSDGTIATWALSGFNFNLLNGFELQFAPSREALLKSDDSGSPETTSLVTNTSGWIPWRHAFKPNPRTLLSSNAPDPANAPQEQLADLCQLLR